MVWRLGLPTLLALLIWSCQEESTIVPVGQAGGRVVNDIYVGVTHPEKGKGPDFLVNLYTSPEDLAANRATQRVKTNVQGYVFLPRVPFGDIWVTCRYPGNPALNDTVKARAGTFSRDTLELILR
jgi:hypothetical protein